MNVFAARVRGFRLVELTMFGAMVALAFGVYGAKTVAGRNHTELARVEKTIEAERQRIRLLKAEVAHLEQPERLGRLSSTYLGMEPVASNREAPAESLEELARQRSKASVIAPVPQPVQAPAPAPIAAPVAVVAADVQER